MSRKSEIVKLYHGQTAHVEVGDGNWNRLSLMVHGCYLHHVTLRLGTLSQTHLQETQQLIYLIFIHAVVSQVKLWFVSCHCTTICEQNDAFITFDTSTHFPLRSCIKVAGKHLNLLTRCFNCTYCSEFKEVLEVLLFISLESVERHFGGQLAAWRTKPGSCLLTFSDFIYCTTQGW